LEFPKKKKKKKKKIVTTLTVPDNTIHQKFSTHISEYKSKIATDNNTITSTFSKIACKSNDDDEASSLLEYYIMSHGKQLLTFQGTAVPSFSGPSSTRRLPILRLLKTDDKAL